MGNINKVLEPYRKEVYKLFNCDRYGFQTCDQIKNQVNIQDCTQMRYEVWNKLYDQIFSQISNRVCNRITNYFRVRDYTSR